MREITILSRLKMRETLQSLDRDVAVISISSSDGERLDELDGNPHVAAVLHLVFDDVFGDDENHMTADDASKVVRFLGALDDGLPLFVHCDGGVSRSAGVGAACMLIENGDDTPIFKSARYVPNMFCYRLVLNSAFGRVDEEEVREKELDNDRIWWSEHDELR